MIINHPQYGEVFVSSDGMMYVYDEERGNVPVGKYNNGEPDVSLFQSPTQSIGQRYYDGERWVSMDDQEAVVMEGITNKVRPLGYVPYSGWTGDQMNWNHYSGAGGNQFASEMDYLNWLYGPGGTVETLYDNQEPQQFYKAPNGADTYLPGRTPLSYDAPDSLGGQLVLAGLGGLAGGALLGPALSGVGGLSSGVTTGAATGFGAGSIGGITEGDLSAALQGGLLGGLTGAAGGGLMDATGLSDYLGNLTGGDVQASGGVDIPDLNQAIGVPADPIEAIYQMTSGNNLTATQAANQSGFGSVQDYLGSINPSWVTGATQLAQSAPSVNQSAPNISQSPTAMSQQELAALIESGTAGNAGAGLESAGVGGGGLTAGQVGTITSGGELSAPTFGNTTNAYQNSGTIGTNGAVTAGAGTAATGTAFSRLLDGTATASDWASVLGNVGATGLGLAGANAQADAFKDVYNQQMSLGQPYRDKLAQSYQPGFSMADQPDFKNALDIGSQSVLRGLSASGGNPYGNAGAMAEANKYVSGSLALPQLNTYRSQLGSFGQLGTNTAGTAALGGAQSNNGTYNALGYGLGQLTQPESPFKGLLNGMFKNSF